MKSSGINRRGFLNRAVWAGMAPGVLARSVAAAERAVTSGTPIPSNNRPRLYFTGQELDQLKQRCRELPPLRAARSELLAQAERALTEHLPEESWAVAGKSQHGNYYGAAAAATRAIETCGFAFALTGEQRFAERAREGLRHFAAYRAWTGRSFARRDPPWHSALETAHFVKAYAIGIDCLGSALNGEELQAAQAALARLGVDPLVADWLDPARRIHALDSMGHNWWMVCVGAAGLGALALLGSDERARDWLRWVVEGVPAFFAYPGNVLQNKPRTFDPDGGFYESLGYANYTLTYFAYLQAALLHVFPEGWAGHDFRRLPEQINGMIEFMLHFTYPCSASQGKEPDFLTVAFGDDGRHTAFSPAVTLFLARMTGDGLYRWYFNRYSHGKVSGFHPMVFFQPSELPPPRSPHRLPRARVLQTIGWAALRDSWTPDATFLAIKCGDTWNHAHEDAASFVVYAGGQPLLIDPGTCSYTRPEYHGYYVKSQAHNVVLFNGEGQPPVDIYRGAKFPGKLHGLIEAPEARYVLADATGPSALHFLRFYRHFLWIDDTIVVVDDLLTQHPGRFEWLFHGENCPEFDGTTLRIANGEAKLEMAIPFPRGLKARKEEGLAFHDPDRKLSYVSLQPPKESKDAKMLAVIRAGRNLPPLKIEAREGKEWIGVAVTTHRGRWRVYCNLRADGRRMHLNSNAVLEDWETDAFLLAVRSSGDQKEPNARAGGFDRVFLAGGSYLRSRSGPIWFDCISKCNLVLDRDADGERVTRIVARATPASVLRVRSTRLPERIVLNGGRPGKARHAGQFVLLGP